MAVGSLDTDSANISSLSLKEEATTEYYDETLASDKEEMRPQDTDTEKPDSQEAEAADEQDAENAEDNAAEESEDADEANTEETEETDASEAEQTQTEDTQTSEPDVSYPAYGEILLTEGGLNMRNGPDSGSDIMASIPCDTTLVITGIKDGWYEVVYNGHPGYVSSDYVTITGEAPESAVNIITTSASADTESTAQTESSSSTQSSSSSTQSSSSSSTQSSSSSSSQTSSSTTTETKSSSSDSSSQSSSSSTSSETSSSSSSDSTASTSTSSSSSDLAAQIVAYAKQLLGCRYVYGTAGPSTFDCSGFTSYVYKHFGYSLSRSAAGQYSNGTVVDVDSMQVGDLLLWRSYGSSKAATHVGIYIGNGQYIHAGSAIGCVTISDMSYGTNARYLVGVRRIIN